jgi:CheY-like chemotaxis protein
MSNQAVNPTGSGLDILVVDDDQGAARTIALILDREGHIVDTANSGREALKIVCAKPFDLIFIDIEMPVMNGVETHRRIKKIRPQAVVVMMTAYAAETMVAQALEDGARDILYKPLDFKKMLDIIHEARASQSDSLVPVVGDNRLRH